MSSAIPRLATAPTAWTIAALLVAAFPHLVAMPPPVAVVILAACAWRLAAAVRSWALPPGWLRLVVSLAAIGLLLATLGGLWGRRAATALLCLMLGMKMLELKRIRDLRLVASVALFLVAAQFLFNERLIYLVYLIASVLTVFAALQRIQQYEMGQQPVSGNTRRLLAKSAALLAAAAPVAVILFLTFPRLAEPLWGLPDAAMDDRTGLSDSMTPGSIAELQIDSSPAFRASFDQQPPPDQRYWRGPVFWDFDGNTWSRAPQPSRAPAPPVPPGDNDYSYTIQLEPHERRWMFALDYPVDTPDKARISADFQITRRHPITTLTQYSMRSNPDFVDMPELPAYWRRLALRLPEDRNPRTRKMADRLRSQFDDDRELIEHVLEWLHNEPFYYSLESAPLGRHGVDEFLFDLRVGYCEYYASAFAVLMRQAGIPARVATGYLGGHWQSGANYFLVRHSEAHAWVEVWLEGRGWTRVDPTAAVSSERIQQGLATAGGGSTGSSWLRTLQNRYDRLQRLWNSWVLNFNAERQQSMFQFAGLPNIPPAGLTILMVSMLGGAAALLFWLWMHQSRSRDPVQRAWQALVHRSRRLDLGPLAGETPAAWAKRLSADQRMGPEFITLVSDYCGIRYGSASDAAQQSRFIKASRSFPAGKQ